MVEFKGIEYFRKGTTLRKVNEDPTLLSFLLLFNRGSVEDSPLLTNKKGGAMDYLETVVNVGSDNEGRGPGAKYAQNLRNFQNLLFKINTEMPWFWESISGLEGTMQYKGMKDPFWGKDKKIEIECLEENVELMATTLMRLYRDACFDFERWVEVIPENLRRFSVDIYVTEVRNFQQKYSDNNTDLFGNAPKGNVDDSEIDSEMLIAPEMSSQAKPFYHVQLGHCTFDIDSGNEMLSALSKNPEMKKPKISFLYQTVRTPSYAMGANLGVLQEVLIEPNNGETPAFNPKDAILGAAKSKFQKLKDKAIGGTLAQVKNLAQGITGGPGLYNVYPNKLLGGAAAQMAGSLVDNLTAKLFLDNVHGASAASTIAGAISQGSINGLLNAAGQLAGNLAGGGSNAIDVQKLPNIFGNLPAIDSSPDGNISPKTIYDQVAPDRDDPINDNVYGGPNTGVDSTPDGNLNDNIHE